MARILSNPTNLLLPTPPQFGQGSDAGTFANDVWTPGRDAAGRVNQASWNLVPGGRWIRAAGTRLDGLQSAITAAIPGWTDGGNWTDLSKSWSSCAVDPDGARLWFLGGGHDNSSNNGLYRFDAYKMAWAIECLPSDSARFTPGYLSSGNFTTDTASAAAATSAKGAGSWSPVNDWFYDEVHADRKPTSRHTYNTLVYAGRTNQLLMLCRRLWCYDLGAGSWTYKRVFNDNDAWPFDPEHGLAIYDEVRNKVLTDSYGSSGLYASIAYDFKSAAWDTSWIASWNTWDLKASARNGRTVAVMRTPGSGIHEWCTYHLDTAALATDYFQYAGGLKQADFGPMLEMPTLVYAPPLNRYWMLTANADYSMSWFEVDPTTTPFTIYRKTFAGSVPTPGSDYNVGQKAMYIPSMNAVVYWDLATRDMSVFKF